nr:reverse transcriptase domain-containing protein [Tanacetum cinerariifolium]
MLLKKLLEKLGDPGKFLIPCNFPGMDVCHTLADLGASINLMPLSIWKNLSLPELTPTQITLELADRSITRPKGVVEDVFVNVGKFHFPTDFVVVDFEADPRVSLILGRPFLRTGPKVPLNENCSGMLLKKLPEKLGDPGKFLIPCNFPGMDVCHTLADLGASINLMPLSIWKNLSLPELTPTQITLELADRSITRPKGVVEDVFVNVGKFYFPTDFVVVDFEADPRVYLILGRPFLRTGRTLIDVYGEEITLRVNDESVTFNLNQTMRYSSTYDDNLVIRINIINIACEEYAQDVLDFMYNSKIGNPTLIQSCQIRKILQSLTLPSTPTLNPGESSGPVPQDEDEREPRFIQAHDPDFVPEPVYPEYIPREDEHVLPAEEQPLPPIDSPIAESPGYVAESDPEEDPEYEDDEEQDGPVDFPMGGGDDGGDDDGNSSRDDAADEDEDMEEEEEDEEEEEEEHIASADSIAVIHVVELVSSPKGTEPVLPPPFIDITTTGASISVWLLASVSLPSTVDIERLLALPTPPLSPLTSLSPPFAGERLDMLTDQSVHPSPLLLPSSGYRRDESPESERPPRKRSCLFVIGSMYEAGESSTTRPTEGQGTDYGFVSIVYFEVRRQGIRDVRYGIMDTWIDPAEAAPAIAPTTVEEVNTRVVELAELYEHNIQDFHALLEDAQDGRSRISQRVDKNSQQVDLLMGDRMTLHETVWTVKEEAYVARVAWNHSIGLSQETYQELQTHRNHTTMAKLRETDRGRQVQLTEILHVIRDMRREMSDMQTELISQREQQIMVRTRRGQTSPPANPNNTNNMTPEAVQTLIDQALLRNSDDRDGSYSSHVENPRNMHTARPCYYTDFMKCHPLNFKGTEGAIRTLGPDAYTMTWSVLKKKMTDKYCPLGEVKKLEIEL